MTHISVQLLARFPQSKCGSPSRLKRDVTDEVTSEKIGRVQWGAVTVSGSMEHQLEARVRDQEKMLIREQQRV